MDNRSATTIFRSKFKQIGILIIIATILGTGIGCEEEDDTSGTPPAPTAATKVDTGVSLATKSSNDLIDLSEVSCDKLKELEKRADFADITFGYYEFDHGKELVQSVSSTLRDEYMGNDYQTKTQSDKTTYSKGSKKIDFRLETDEGAQLGYSDRDTSSNGGPEKTKEETLKLVRDLVVKKLKLGDDKDFYIPEIEDLSYVDGGVQQPDKGSGGQGQQQPPKPQFREIRIRRVLSGLTYAPRLEMARVVYSFDGTLLRFYFGGAHAGKQLGVIKGSELIKVSDALNRAKQKVQADGRNVEDYNYKCTIGYDVNRKAHNIGTMLAPVYRIEIESKQGKNPNDHGMYYKDGVQFPATEKSEVAEAFKDRKSL